MKKLIQVGIIKLVLSTLLLSVLTTSVYAQQNQVPTSLAKDEVSLIVSGDGSTKEEATKAALRSAIELAFGTFVSSNTQVLNDELVKDEIITVSSGNVKNYKYIYEKEENGKYYVSLQTTVVVGKLIEYTKSKGASAELAGATFAMNMKMKKLEEKNVSKAIDMLEKQITPLLKNCFSFNEIKVGEPKLHYSGKVRVPLTIFVTTNENFIQAKHIADNTAEALAEHITLPFKAYNYGRNERLVLSNVAHNKEKFVLLFKHLAGFYIPYEALFKFQIVDNLGTYTTKDERIGSVSVYDTSNWKYYVNYGGQPGHIVGRSDFDYSSHSNPRFHMYDICYGTVGAPYVYVIGIELFYTEEEIAKISDIKVSPINENK